MKVLAIRYATKPADTCIGRIKIKNIIKKEMNICITNLFARLKGTFGRSKVLALQISRFASQVAVHLTHFSPTPPCFLHAKRTRGHIICDDPSGRVRGDAARNSYRFAVGSGHAVPTPSEARFEARRRTKIRLPLT